MDHFKALRVFAEVSDQGSFAAAARALNFSTSAVSRYVSGLEDWLGTQVFHRTPRQLDLTVEGASVLALCRRILSDVDNLERSVKAARTEPQGVLRVTSPVYLTKFWASGILTAYLQKHPKVELDLVVVDRHVKLIEEGFDVAIRAGELEDSTLKARKIGTSRLKLVASPDYLQSNGRPSTPNDLRKHCCIIDTVPSYADRWPIGERKLTSRPLGQGQVRVNNGEIARDLAIAGLGITLLPDFMVDDVLSDGRLIPLLDEYAHYEAGIFVVYPQSRYVSVNARSLIDFLVAHSGEIGC